MEPGIIEGDALWVRKLGIRHEAVFPFPHKEMRDGEEKIVWWNRVKLDLPYHYKWKRGDIALIARPNERSRLAAIKRIVGLPGDTVKIRNRKISVNNQVQLRNYPIKLNYRINFSNLESRVRIAEQLQQEPAKISTGPFWMLTLTDSQYVQLSSDTGVLYIRPIFQLASNASDAVWPRWKRYGWNVDNYGPVWIPKAGDSLELNASNVRMYAALVAREEASFLSYLPRGIALVDGKVSSHYTFKNNYYFVLGDNRHLALDSRFYGPIPEHRLLGKAGHIMFGTFSDQKGLKAVNWNRTWQRIK